MNTSLNTPTVQLAKTPQFSCVIRAKVKELNTSIQNKIKGFYQGLINHLKVARSNNNEEENIQWLVEIQTDFRSAFET